MTFVWIILIIILVAVAAFLTLQNLRLRNKMTSGNPIAGLADAKDQIQADANLIMQHDLALKLASADSLSGVFPHCVDAAMKISGMDCGSIFLRNERTGRFLLEYAIGLSEVFLKNLIEQAPSGSQIQLLLEGRPICLSGQDLFDSFAEQTVSQEGLKTLGLIPLSRTGKTIGCMGLGSHANDSISHQACIALDEMCLQISNAIARLRAGQIIRYSEQHFEAFIENTPHVAIQGFDRNGVIRHWNPASARLYGHDAREAIGCRVQDILLSPDQVAWFEDTISKMWDTGQSAEPNEWITRTRNGEERHVYSAMFPIVQEGDVVEVFCMDIDVTEHKKAEEALLTERSMFVQGPVVVFKWGRGLDWPVQYVSPNIKNEFGYAPDDLYSGKITYHNMIHPDDRQRVLDCIAENYAAGNNNYTQQYRIACADGKIKRVSDHTTVIRDADGKIFHYLGYVEDISERKQQESDLRESQQMLQLVLNTIPQRVFWKDKNSVYLGCNLPFAHDAGLNDPKDIIGKNDYELAWRKNAEKYRSDDAEVMKSNLPKYAYEETQTEVDNSISCLRTNKIPLCDTNGRVYGVLGSYEDITDIKRGEEEIIKARDVAEKASMIRSQFLANMSHEIRTPLTGITGMLELLLDTPLTPLQRDYAGTASQSTAILLTVINDILDLSKIDAGMLEMESVAFSPGDCAEEVCDLMAKTAGEKGIELVIDIDSQIPPRVIGDPNRLRQILLNLVNNAVKFTDHGEVVVRALLDHTENSRICLRFNITDTGIGISKENQQQLFRPFKQADASVTRKFGGTGLGLTICQQLVERMNGTISISSEPGKGSVFTFTARFGRVEDKSDIRTIADMFTVRDKLVQLRDQRVMVVDDNNTSRTVVAAILRQAGCDVSEAVDGASALAMMRGASAGQDTIRIVLMDLHLPKMDGLQLARNIRLDPAMSQTRLILMTSLPRSLNHESLGAHGIDQSISKPIRRAALYRTMMKIITEEAPAITVTPEPGAGTKLSMPLTKRILMAEDNQVNQKVAKEIIRRTDYSCDIVSNGREAIEAIKNRNYDLVLMDCQMPIMDGYQAVREIRRLDGPMAHVPIIAMTAHALHGDRERCIAAGMDDYISKPLQLMDLKQMIEKHINAGAENSVNGRPQTTTNTGAVTNTHELPPTESEAQFQLLDLRRIKEISAGNPELEAELINAFTSGCEKRLKDLREAINKGDSARTRLEAHTVKGSSRELGARDMTEAAAKLEAVAIDGLPDKLEAIRMLDHLQKEFLKILRMLNQMGKY
ncbi:MAG: response regulator [bacterium]